MGGSTTADAFFREVAQGHVFDRPQGDPDLFSRFPEGTSQAVVVSQTCDVVLPKIPAVVLAPVVSLSEPHRSFAAHREMPRYVHLPCLGSDQFADLAYLQSLAKNDLVDAAHISGIADDDMTLRSFSLAIGRWFSRLPFPDDIVPWFQPLLARIREKYRRPASSLGQVLQNVAEIRVETDNWSDRPLNLTLHVIVHAGVIPTLEDDSIDQNTAVEARTSTGAGSPSDIADLLVAATDDRAKATLWPLLADSLASICRPVNRDDTGTASPVREIVAQLWQDDDFPLSRVRRSEVLDLGYLSAGSSSEDQSSHFHQKQ